MVISCVFFSKLSDKIGRKKTLMLISIPHCISWICTIVSKNLYVLYAARLFGGTADGCLLVTLPVYIGEISVPKVRGVWGNLVAVCTFFGIFLINVVGSQCSVEVTAYIFLPIPIIFILSMHFLPESHYWYIMHERDEDAKKSLRSFRGIQDVDNIFIKLKEDIDKQMKEAGTWTDLVTIPTNRRGLIAGIFLRVSQLFGGVGALMTYTQYVFASLKIDIPSEIPTIVFSGVCFVLLLVTGYFIERVGKKKCFIITSFLNAIILLLEAIYFYYELEVPEVDLSKLNWFPIAGMVLYAVFCSFGSIPIPNVMLGELFSTSIKAKGVTALIITFGLAFSASNFIFYTLNTKVGMYGPFLFFGISNLISSVVAFYLLPETAGKTLEEIQMILK